jgi:aconitate hydratase
LGKVFVPLIEAETPAAAMVHNLIQMTGLGSVIFAVKPGDGSAREQAASCQKVLGGYANIACEYATKRYRSNLINWGMIPFTMEPGTIDFAVDDFIFIPGIRRAVASGATEIEALVIGTKEKRPLKLYMQNLSQDERDIILAGCLINYYARV